MHYHIGHLDWNYYLQFITEKKNISCLVFLTVSVLKSILCFTTVSLLLYTRKILLQKMGLCQHKIRITQCWIRTQFPAKIGPCKEAVNFPSMQKLFKKFFFSFPISPIQFQCRIIVTEPLQRIDTYCIVATETKLLSQLSQIVNITGNFKNALYQVNTTDKAQITSTRCSPRSCVCKSIFQDERNNPRA